VLWHHVKLECPSVSYEILLRLFEGYRAQTSVSAQLNENISKRVALQYHPFNIVVLIHVKYLANVFNDVLIQVVSVKCKLIPFVRVNTVQLGHYNGRFMVHLSPLRLYQSQEK